MAPGPMLHFFLLAALAPLWLVAGRAAQRLRLPLITGMMLAGAATGPEALGLLSAQALEALTTVDHVCLSLIALAAGAELQLGELRRLGRQVGREGGGLRHGGRERATLQSRAIALSSVRLIAAQAVCPDLHF